MVCYVLPCNGFYMYSPPYSMLISTVGRNTLLAKKETPENHIFLFTFKCTAEFVYIKVYRSLFTLKCTAACSNSNKVQFVFIKVYCSLFPLKCTTFCLQLWCTAVCFY